MGEPIEERTTSSWGKTTPSRGDSRQEKRNVPFVSCVDGEQVYGPLPRVGRKVCLVRSTRYCVPV